MPDWSIWIVGEVSRAELREALGVFGGREVRETTVESALAQLVEGAAPPDLIVLVEDRPGLIAGEDVDALRHLAPLTRFVGLLGSWCEGETRTGRPWPGVTRLYWHQFAVRMRAELERLSSGDRPHWSLPSTAGDEERLFDAGSTIVPSMTWGPRADEDSRVGVVARPPLDAMLADWCRAQGVEPVLLNLTAGLWPAQLDVDAVLYDVAGPIDAAVLDDVRRLATTAADASLTALCSYPRAEDVRQLLEAGASHVLAKPLQIADLAFVLDRRPVHESIDPASPSQQSIISQRMISRRQWDS